MRVNAIFFILQICVLKDLVMAIEELEELGRVDEPKSIGPMLVGATFRVG